MRIFEVLATLLMGVALTAGAAPAVTGTAGSAVTGAPNSAGSAADSAELAAFKQTIRRLYDMKEKAWAAGDVETIVARFYSADAVSVGEGEPVTAVGRESFRHAYQQYLKDVSAVRIESVRTVVNGNAGWDWANFYATVKPDKVKDYPPSPVRILFLWSKENGHWVCKGDMFVNGKFNNPLGQ